METLIYNLLAYINNSLDKDINYHIAKTLLENFQKIEGFSLETAAEVCNVAPSTINRFCKRIGFRNFSSLRNSVTKYGAPLETNDITLSGDSFIAQLKENVEIIETIPKEQIKGIVKQISKSRRVVILGFEKHQIQALELQKKILLAGKFCECNTNIFKQMDTLDLLSEEDMIITISIHGHLLAEDFLLFEKIKRTKAKKLLITFSKPQQHLELFDEVLQCGKIENSAVSSQTLLRLFDVLFH
ncbi:RpiR family transcriptional regulator [Trichococcus patagoniensis]|uniref:RpiR family transcriptional regulator n=1 Tax=Trichococcus patagoniensis TaxID=382641 RepID=A0A2T5IFU3_9LACT|nr:SIS domain-containing protein [Trichococcus patagoniensis]PTQ82716.1 RpiR family transcriptional regulator [Trichococcus patagoniensis]